MERIVKIRLDGGKMIEKTVSAVTFGELKEEIQMNFTNQKVIIRETHHTLEDPSAQLPLTNFHLFVYPVQVKSGGEYTTLNYHALRRLCIERKVAQVPGSNNGNYGSVAEMVKKLEAADKKVAKTTVPTPVAAPKSVAKTAVAETNVSEAKAEVVSAIGRIQGELEDLKTLVENLPEASVAAEVDTLSEEFEAVRNVLRSFGVR